MIIVFGPKGEVLIHSGGNTVLKGNWVESWMRDTGINIADADIVYFPDGTTIKKPKKKDKPK